jgi:hypothetical protein
MRRDGGCARPGCPETRIERLHAHHMRHWLFGGRTDIANLVLLCDRDHGLVHDLGLAMARRDGVLVVTDPDGRRLWGAADAAFSTGLAGLEGGSSQGDGQFVGVHPLDTAFGRRPRAPRSDRGSRHPAGRSDRVTRPRNAQRDSQEPRPISPIVFPGGEPPLPDAMQANGERADIRYVVGVLMGNRDLVRRLAAENGGVPAGTW